MTNNLFVLSVRNNVLSLKTLKKNNYALYKYYINNKQLLKRRFQADGIDVLNDIYTLNTYSNIKLYLRYIYGGIVDLRVLREKDWTVYNYISRIGKVQCVVKEMGFEVVSEKDKLSLDYIHTELKRLADKDNFVHKLNDSQLYSKIQYCAKKDSISVRQYIENLGFHYGLNVNYLVQLHLEGHSKTYIAKALNISPTTVTRTLKKVGELN